MRDIATDDVLRVLRPIWSKKPETASRLRGRIEVILDPAAAEGVRTGDNPARWRGHLSTLLPDHAKVAKVRHHPALPWTQIGKYIAELREPSGPANWPAASEGQQQLKKFDHLPTIGNLGSFTAAMDVTFALHNIVILHRLDEFIRHRRDRTVQLQRVCKSKRMQP